MPNPARKRLGELEALVRAPDKVEHCASVSLADSSEEHQLAVIVHNDMKIQEEACLLLLSFSTGTDKPVVQDMLPICADLDIDIEQTKPLDKVTRADLLVTLTVKGRSLAVFFTEKDAMANSLASIRHRKATATPMPDSHAWAEAYYTVPGLDTKLRRSNTMPPGELSYLHYILPEQPDAITAKKSLRRTGTVASKMLREKTANEAKEHWINARLMDQENTFVKWDEANVFVGTWNVHGSLPTESLSAWILDSLKASDDQPFDPDFYVIGLQEMDTSTGAYVRYDPTRENAWTDAIFKALGDRAKDYYKIASQQLVTMLLIVVGKATHHHYISEVETSYAGVGLMNMMGNKGGTAVRLRFHDSYYCFVTCHLAAFTDEIKRRNQDFLELSKRLVFPHRVDALTSYVHYSWNDGGDEGVAFLENNNTLRDWSKEVSVFHADHLIWLGDLNYRVNMTEPEIKTRLRKTQLASLLDYDQLCIERQAGRAFPMFEEGAIHFFPTYKFDAGTNEYDTSEKRRAPSWTDRILWKKDRETTSGEEEKKVPLKLLAYESCMKMMLSDHKPVRALIKTKVRKIDSRKQLDTRKQLTQNLVELNDVQPRVRLLSSYVDFGDVQFMEYKEKTLVLENTGQVLAQFRFISMSPEMEICPPWLQVHPLSGVLGPGEKTVLHFSLMIDSPMSIAFNEGDAVLDDNLILHLEQGSDYFVAITGKYIPTCFGMPLERLGAMAIPVSEIAASKKHKPVSDMTEQQQQQAVLPKELWRVLNFLWNKNMLSISTLFLDHGDRVISNYIRKCLDTGDPFDTSVLLGDNDEDMKDRTKADQDTSAELEASAANSMVDVLVAFFECLPDSVVPSSLYEQALACTSPEGMAMLSETIPPVNGNVLLYVTSFLKDAMKYAPKECMVERHTRLVEIFTVLLRPANTFKEHNPAKAKAMRERFIAQLLKRP